jgi:hypothetical protein
MKSREGLIEVPGALEEAVEPLASLLMLVSFDGSHKGLLLHWTELRVEELKGR